MDAQRIAVDAAVALTDCDRDAVAAFIRRLYLGRREGPQAADLQGPASHGAGLTASRASLLNNPQDLRRRGDRFQETVDLGLQAGG